MDSDELMLMGHTDTVEIGDVSNWDFEPLVCGSCLSDLSVISKYGSSSAYGFGMGRDFSLVGGAHQPNEFNECDMLVKYTKTIAAYVISIKSVQKKPHNC